MLKTNCLQPLPVKNSCSTGTTNYGSYHYLCHMYILVLQKMALVVQCPAVLLLGLGEQIDPHPSCLWVKVHQEHTNIQCLLFNYNIFQQQCFFVCTHRNQEMCLFIPALCTVYTTKWHLVSTTSFIWHYQGVNKINKQNDTSQNENLLTNLQNKMARFININSHVIVHLPPEQGRSFSHVLLLSDKQFCCPEISIV